MVSKVDGYSAIAPERRFLTNGRIIIFGQSEHLTYFVKNSLRRFRRNIKRWLETLGPAPNTY